VFHPSGQRRLGAHHTRERRPDGRGDVTGLQPPGRRSADHHGNRPGRVPQQFLGDDRNLIGLTDIQQFSTCPVCDIGEPVGAPSFR